MPPNPTNPSHLGTTTKPLRYTSGIQIQSALRTENPDGLTQVLTSIRNQLSLKTQEVSVTPQDERLIIAKQWMVLSPGAQDLFDIWDQAHPRQYSTLSLVISTLSAVLALLSTHYPDHSVGHPIMKTLLQPVSLRCMNSYIGGSHNELIIVTLKLYNVMSSFAGGKDKNSVLAGFGWDIKSLPRLLNMRRRTPGTADQPHILLRPGKFQPHTSLQNNRLISTFSDIRTLFILFLLSFVDADASTQSKNMFLEQRRDIFLSAFKGIAQDQYSVAKRILETCWTGIWSDNKVKRTLKIGLFNETTIGHLIKLYDRIQPAGAEADHVPADLVHHFLLAIGTRPGTGICFKDRGWYPRETDPDGVSSKEDDTKRTGRIYNRILANVLKSLKVNEDSRQQELAMKVLEACPELVSGYWPAVSLTLEPRLSTKWITNISFFANVISLPIPTATFYLSNQLYNPTPPPLSTILENVLPSVNTKKNISKGLQSSCGLVQHCTALALSKCLIKYQHVLKKFREIALALEEDDDGQWSRRCMEVESEVRKRVPDFMVVVAFGQQTQQAPTKTTPAQINQNKMALLAEIAQRLLWLYQHCLSVVVSEARFDVGKILQTFVSNGGGMSDEHEPDAAKRLHRVQQLHVLNILRDSDQFSWSVKSGSLLQTPFFILLNAFAVSTLPAIKISLRNLICHILARSILFQEDAQEPELWLEALPEHRSTVSELPADLLIIDMQEENDCVITFLDECVQKCLRTPYKYVEALRSLADASTDYSNRLDERPSPLLMTLLEHLQSRINNRSLPSTLIIAVTAFIRRLTYCLLGKSDLGLLRAFVDKVENVLIQNSTLDEGQSRTETMGTALKRELQIMRSGLTFNATNDLQMAVETEGAQRWLATSESLSIPATKTARKDLALRIIDSLRTMTLSADQLKRLFTIVVALDVSVISRAIEYLIPGQTDLWQAVQLAPDFSVFRPHLRFDRLYIHTSPEQLLDEDKQKVLVESIYIHQPTVIELRRIVCYVTHGITASRENHDILKAHVALLARISEIGRLTLCTKDFDALREVIFVDSSSLRDLFLSVMPVEVLKEIQHLLEACFSHSLPSDRKMLSHLSGHWFDLLKSDMYNSVQDSAMTASLWIKYLEPLQLLDLLDRFIDVQSSDSQEPATVVLEILARLASSEWPNEAEYVRRLPRLLSLRHDWNSPLLDQVIASVVECSLPMHLEGFLLPSIQGNFASLIARSSSRWTGYFSSIKAWSSINVEQVFSRDVSESTIRIVTGLLYRHPSARVPVLQWISDIKDADVTLLLPIIQAFLDVSSSSETYNSEDYNWIPFVPQLAAVIADQDVPPLSRSRSQYSLVNILASKTQRSSVLRILATKFKSLSKNKPTRELLILAIWLGRHLGAVANEVVSEVLDAGLRSSIDSMVEEECLDEFLRLLASLVASTRTQPHLVEIVLSVIIQHRLSDPAALQLAISSLSSCHLKPGVVNQHLQSIIQHQHFFKLCQSLGETRELLIDLLSRLFHLHPHNTCQITHIDPLIKVYRGTLSNCDLQILSILQLFEKQRKLSVAPLLSSWSTTPNSASNTALEAVQSLDPTIVFLTCMNFPRWRRIHDSTFAKANTTESKLYDPVFLLLLFNQVMAERLPSSSIAWLELLRTNVVSLFLRSLSAKDGQIRELALCQIVSLWKCLENNDFQEKPQVQYIFNLLKQLLPDPSLSKLEYPRRLPTYTSLLLCHALRTVFYPTNSLYPLISRFLLQRPALDISDVPMLYTMLYNSSDDDWKKERTWIIKFLADGMVGSEDWKILKRRHTWDLLASLFQSENDMGSVGLRAGILEVLANLTCNAQATTSLILKSGLLAWIEIQLLHGVSVHERGVEWLKILENILVIVNPGKIEMTTNGDWRRIICRCLCHLLDGKLPNNLVHAAPAILRLASLGDTDQPNFSALLALAFRNLENLEAQIQDIASDRLMVAKSKYSLATSPHRSITLHQRIDFETILEPGQKLSLWGKLVDMLLQSCMFLNQKPPVWDDLVPRILIWRSLRGHMGDDGDISEWVRREVIVNLQGGVDNCAITA